MCAVRSDALSLALPHLADVEVEEVSLAAEPVRILAREKATSAACPGCGTVPRRIHSRYERRLLDAAIAGREAVICLQVRQFLFLSAGARQANVRRAGQRADESARAPDAGRDGGAGGGRAGAGRLELRLHQRRAAVAGDPRPRLCRQPHSRPPLPRALPRNNSRSRTSSDPIEDQGGDHLDHDQPGQARRHRPGQPGRHPRRPRHQRARAPLLRHRAQGRPGRRYRRAKPSLELRCRRRPR